MKSTKWKNVAIWKTILKETDKSLLIQCPNTCAYRKHMFWYPKKLIDKIQHSKDTCYLTYFDDMEIVLQNQDTKDKVTIKSQKLFREIEMNRYKK